MAKAVLSPNYVVLASFPLVICLMATAGIFNIIFNQRTSFDVSGASVSRISPWRWLFAVLATAFICRYGYQRKSLSLSGSIMAFFIGFILTLSSFTFFGALLAMYLVTSKATRFRQHLKRQIDPHFKTGGQRNFIQVLCNGIVPADLAALYLLDHGPDAESPFDFSADYFGSYWACGILGALACVAGDTLASELAPVLVTQPPRLITTFKRVPVGTNGGVTTLGIFFSVVGGCAVGVGAWLCTILTVPSGILQRAPSQLFIIALCGLAGLVGSLIDSLLGATLQYSGVDPATGGIVDSPYPAKLSPSKYDTLIDNRRKILRISGYPLLNNHSVNLLSVLLTAFITPKLAVLMYSVINYAS